MTISEAAERLGVARPTLSQRRTPITGGQTPHVARDYAIQATVYGAAVGIAGRPVVGLSRSRTRCSRCRRTSPERQVLTD